MEDPNTSKHTAVANTPMDDKHSHQVLSGPVMGYHAKIFGWAKFLPSPPLQKWAPLNAARGLWVRGTVCKLAMQSLGHSPGANRT